MRKTLCALVLVLALCGSAFAGDINNPPVTAPGDMICPPGVSQSANDQTTVSSTDAEASPTTADALAATALTFINSVLALF